MHAKIKIAGQQIGLLIGTWVGENTLFFRSLVWSMVQNDAIRTNLSKQMLSENWNISGRAVLIIFICLLLCIALAKLSSIHPGDRPWGSVLRPTEAERRLTSATDAAQPFPSERNLMTPSRCVSTRPHGQDARAALEA